MQDNLISVSEYAKRLNISVQAAYKQVNGKLKPYLIMVNGKKMLQPEALEAFKENSIKPVTAENEFKSLEIQIQILNGQIEDLKQQREYKDQLIEKLSNIISVYSSQATLPESSKAVQDATKRHWWQFGK